MSDRKPQKGDRVRITYEAEYLSEAEALGPDGTVVYPVNSTVEVLEPADDPSKDQVGTVRQSPDGRVAHKLDTDDQPWAEYIEGFTSYGWLGDRDVTGWEVIGSVPGTPAAEQQQDETPLPEWEMELLEQEAARRPGPRPGPRVPRTLKPAREPRVFSSDGPEPPDDVKVLTDGGDDMGFLVRHPDGWVWRDDPKFDPEDSCLAERWATATHPIRNVSPQLREVLDA